MMITFDESLPAFATLVVEYLGESALVGGVFLRDAIGKLLFILPEKMDSEKVRALQEKSLETLVPYVDKEFGAVISSDEFSEVIKPTDARKTLIRLGNGSSSVRLLDRRIIGQDWSADPSPGWQAPAPARLVFWSLKGGVGRSTALAVTATDLAQQGKRVLVLDLDLEAPGLGSALLNNDELPLYGSLDWFIEDGFSIPDERFLENLIAPSTFAQGMGLLHVIPAIGRIGRSNPENVISKLGRAYLENVDSNGEERSFLRQAQELVDRVEKHETYDVMLVDARSGLNEATAAAILGLGADVLLFGENTPQTFDGYRYLLAHMRDMPVSSHDDWRLRLKMIHAKASSGNEKRFNDRSFELFAEFLYEEQGAGNPDSPNFEDAFNFDIDDPDAPHVPWIVYNDSRYYEFDPLTNKSQLDEGLYRATFGHFINGVLSRIGGSDSE